MVIKIEVTKFCDQKCNHCVFSRKYSQDERHLTLKDLKNKTNNQIKNSHVLITGGEPLLNPEIFDIIDYLKNEGARFITLATNGLPLINNELMKSQLASSQINEVLFSVSTSEKEYIESRVSNSLNDVLKVAQDIKKLNPKIIITGNYLAHRDNFSYLVELINKKSDFDLIRFLSYRSEPKSQNSMFSELNKMQLFILDVMIKLQSLTTVFKFLSKIPSIMLLKTNNDQKLDNLLFIDAT